MASTFVGAPTALRAQVAPRRGSRSTRALTRADAAAQASLAVTPATVAVVAHPWTSAIAAGVGDAGTMTPCGRTHLDDAEGREMPF